jgi:hypothetical protein
MDKITLAINKLNEAINSDEKSWSYAMNEMTTEQNEALVKLLNICEKFEEENKIVLIGQQEIK